MSIVGIDYDKCSNCKVCLTTCVKFRYDRTQEKVIFDESPDFECNLCGHCIAKCPEDAILHEGCGEVYEFEGIRKPVKLASYDTIYKILRANRSIRVYKGKKVPKDVLEKVFEAMTHAPTADNRRTESFSLLSDDDQMKHLNDAVIEELLRDSAAKDRYGELFLTLGKFFRSPIFFDAPHVILVDSEEDSKMEAVNIGIIITYGRLAAQALGLGTCWNGWTQIAMKNNPKVRELANIKGKTVGVFIIGYPAERYYRSPPRTPKKIYGL